MLKWLCVAAVGPFILTPIMTKAAFSTIITLDYQYPEVPKSKVDVPVCYIQMSDGRVLNLQKLCSEAAPGNNNAFPENNSFPGTNSSSQNFPEAPRRRFGTGASYASDH